LELQRHLAHWRMRLPQMIAEAQQWSQCVLQMSGLLAEV
jgi:hypothetical protein